MIPRDCRFCRAPLYNYFFILFTLKYRIYCPECSRHYNMRCSALEANPW